jgi:hypothetical protein
MMKGYGSGRLSNCMGPGAGFLSSRFEGLISRLKGSKVLTGQYLSGKKSRAGKLRGGNNKFIKSSARNSILRISMLKYLLRS